MIPARPEVPPHVYEPTVRDVMHYAHCVLAPSESLARAHEKMRLFHCAELAVVDEEKVVGVVTTRSLHRVRASSRGVKAADVMEKSVVAVDPQMLARDVGRVADEHRATHVAVVHRGVVIGTFAIEDTRLADVARAPARPKRKARRSPP